MALDHGPTPVINGLILNYDMANFRSYSGTGRTINNIIQSGFGATTVNTPTFSSSNLGYLTFASASSQFGIFPHFGRTLTNFTVEVWYWLNSLPPGNPSPQVAAFVTQQFTTAGQSINFSLGFNGSRINNGAWDGNVNGGFYDGTNGRWQVTDGFLPVINTWYQSAVTFNGTTITDFRNGSALGSTSPPTFTLGSGTNFNYLMRRWDDTNFIDGRLAIVRIYDRALSGREISQNFNANRERFGI